ncbi:hypothetical protein N657DRAFT_208707 [Parathielavia appendiculata]|uniref:Uncharacterized protein n=1 Tax=Parathielavia appendiculata TaxID=2587402 RepID=A0AAN6U6I8_9PEZI|nr:hypothetical protein N657DRAFT_208707 [Parathielavia appendiculata]
MRTQPLHRKLASHKTSAKRPRSTRRTASRGGKGASAGPLRVIDGPWVHIGSASTPTTQSMAVVDLSPSLHQSGIWMTRQGCAVPGACLRGEVHCQGRVCMQIGPRSGRG